MICCVSQSLVLTNTILNIGRSTLAFLPQYTYKLHTLDGANSRGPTVSIHRGWSLYPILLATLRLVSLYWLYWTRRRWGCWAWPEDISGPSFPVTWDW